MLKGSSAGQAIHVDKEQRGGTGGMGNYTVYVNPYLVLKSGSYTKLRRSRNPGCKCRGTTTSKGSAS